MGGVPPWWYVVGQYGYYPFFGRLYTQITLRAGFFFDQRFWETVVGAGLHDESLERMSLLNHLIFNLPTHFLRKVLVLAFCKQCEQKGLYYF